MIAQYRTWTPPKHGLYLSFPISALLGRVATFWRQLDRSILGELFSCASKLQEAERLEVWACLRPEQLQLCVAGASLGSDARESLLKAMKDLDGQEATQESNVLTDELQPFWGATRQQLFRCAIKGGPLGNSVLTLSEEGEALHFQAHIPSPDVLSSLVDPFPHVSIQIAERQSDAAFNEEGDRISEEASTPSSEKIPLPPPLPYESETVLLPEALSVGDSLPTRHLKEEPPQLVGDNTPTRLLGEEQSAQLLGDELSTRMLDNEFPTRILGDDLPTRVLQDEPLPSFLSAEEDMKTPVEGAIFDANVITETASLSDAMEGQPLETLSLSDAIVVEAPPSQTETSAQEDETPAETVSLSDAILVANIPAAASIDVSLSDAIVVEELSSTRAEELVDVATPVEASNAEILAEASSMQATWSDEILQMVLSRAPTWSSCRELGETLGQSPDTIARIFALASGVAQQEGEATLAASVRNAAQRCGWILGLQD